MKILIKAILPVIYFLLFSQLNITNATAQNERSNLVSYEVTDDRGNTFRGYAEPVSNIDGARTRILVFPKIEFAGHDPLAIRNLEGVEVNLDNINTLNGPFTARVSLRVVSNLPDIENRRRIVWELHNNNNDLNISYEFPQLPPSTGDYSIDMQRANEHTRAVQEWNNANRVVDELLDNFQFVPIFPQHLRFDLEVFGEAIGHYTVDSESSVSPGSIFQINVPFSDNRFNYRLLLENDYIAKSTFLYPTSRFQSASAAKYLDGFSSFVEEHIRNEVVRARQSSSRFLMFNRTSRSVNTFIEQESNKTLESEITTRYVYNVRDADENLTTQVENFLFPELSLQQTITNHTNAAIKAREDGNEELAEIHNTYRDFLLTNEDDLTSADHINVLDALTSLSDGAIEKFLAQGFAFKESSQSGRFSFRQIASGNYSVEQNEEFNALIFQSLLESHVLTISPRSKENDNNIPPEVFENMVLIEGGEVLVGEDFSNPNMPIQGGYNFLRNQTYTKDNYVTLGSYYISKYVVRQKEFTDFMGYNNSEINGDYLPVTNVSWLEALEYANALSLKYGLTPAYEITRLRVSNRGYSLPLSHDEIEVTIKPNSNGFRLPTAAQWEFAAKGGNRTNEYYYSGSHVADEVAWYSNNSNGQIRLPGRKKANELGLYDMSGNVMEWNWNSKADMPLGPNELHSPRNKFRKIVRGGSFKTHSGLLVPWQHLAYERDYKSDDLGFRLVLLVNTF